MNSVVSSRFGNRPVLDIPALQIASQKTLEVPSLQAPALPSFNNPRPDQNFMPSVDQHPTFNKPLSLFPGQMIYPEFGRRHHTAPNGSFYNPHGLQYNYNPYGDFMRSAQFSQFQGVYPGISNAPPAYAPAPHAGPPAIPYNSYGLTGPESSVICELEYGRVMNIDLNRCVGEFRGIPPFLRTELMRGYSSYPYMKVKITQKGGEFHVFASHNGRRNNRSHRKHESDWDSESNFQYDDDDDDYDDRFADFRSDVDFYNRRARRRNQRNGPRSIIEERRFNRLR